MFTGLVEAQVSRVVCTNYDLARTTRQREVGRVTQNQVVDSIGDSCSASSKEDVVVTRGNREAGVGSDRDVVTGSRLLQRARTDSNVKTVVAVCLKGVIANGNVIRSVGVIDKSTLTDSQVEVAGSVLTQCESTESVVLTPESVAVERTDTYRSVAGTSGVGPQAARTNGNIIGSTGVRRQSAVADSHVEATVGVCGKGVGSYGNVANSKVVGLKGATAHRSVISTGGG